jgi:hypothetical protein
MPTGAIVLCAIRLVKLTPARKHNFILHKSKLNDAQKKQYFLSNPFQECQVLFEWQNQRVSKNPCRKSKSFSNKA